MTKNLHKAHARAHALGRNALDVFQSLAADLRLSAEGHKAVADTAHDEAMDLLDLRDSAKEAAVAAERKAAAIGALVA